MDSSNHIAEINELLDKIASDIVSLNFTNSYKKEKQEILRIFRTTGGDNYNQESIELRLIVIDSLYLGINVISSLTTIVAPLL